MATTSTFSNMLNEYLTNDLLKEEIIKRDYLLTKVEKDNGWKGGALPVPFKGGAASSIAMGELTDESEVTEDLYVRGQVDTYKEMWGTMVFNHKDLVEHDGSGIKEKTFLKVLPDAVEDFGAAMKNQTSIYLMNGPHLVKRVAQTTGTDDEANGLITVDRPDRLTIGQKLYVKDNNTALSAVIHVVTIDMEHQQVYFEDATNVAFDFTNYTVAQAAKFYVKGADQSAKQFTSLKQQLLSVTAGGDAAIFGVTKKDYPFTQAINVNGASVTAANILSKIFDAYITIRQFGKGDPREVIMSYKHWGSVLKALETSKGAFNVVPGSMKTSVYGWTEVEVGGIKGSLKLVAIQEVDDDVIMFIDWKAIKFHSNNMFKRLKTPDGLEYYTKRTTSGYKYFVDISLFGELILNRPSYCGILHSISY